MKVCLPPKKKRKPASHIKLSLQRVLQEVQHHAREEGSLSTLLPGEDQPRLPDGYWLGNPGGPCGVLCPFDMGSSPGFAQIEL